MATIAKLMVGLGIDAKEFHSGIASARQEVERTQGAFGKMGSAVSAVTTGFAKFGLAAMGVQAATGAVSGLANALGFGLQNEMEQVSASINAFTKDSTKTAEILAMVRQEAAATPFGFREMATAASALLPITKSAGIGLQDMLKQAEILAASNPFEGLAGASFAMREAMSGDFTSLIERFNVSRSTINKLKEEGVSNFEIIGLAMQEMGYDADLVAAKAQTLDGRWSTFMDTVDEIRLRLSAKIFDLAKLGLIELQMWFDANQGRIMAAATAIGTAFGTLAQMIAAGVQAAQGPLQGFIAAVEGPVQGLIGALQPLAAFVQEHFTQIATVVGVAVAAFLTLSTVIGVVTSVAAAITAFGAASTAAGGTIGLLVAVLGGPLTLAIGAVALAIGALVLAWTQNWGDIQGKTASAWAVIQPVLQEIGDRLSAFGQMILPELVGAWESMQRGVEAVANAIRDIVEPVFSGIASFLQGHGDEIQQIVTAAWEYIQRTIDNLLSVISNVIQLALNVIQGDWSGAWTNIKNIAAALWDQIKNVIDLAVNAIPPLITLALDAIKTLMSGAWEAIKQTAATAWEGVKTAIGEAWEGIKTAVSTGIAAVEGLMRGLPGQITAALGYLGTLLYDAGADVVRGLVNGITSQLQSALEAVRGLAGSIAGAARDALGIGSPSKVFHLIGEQVGDGLVIGVASKAQEIADVASAVVWNGVMSAASAAQSAVGAAMGGIGGFDPVASGYTPLAGGGWQKRTDDGGLLLDFGGPIAPGHPDQQVPGQPPGVTYGMLWGAGAPKSAPIGKLTTTDPYSSIDEDRKAFPKDTGQARFSGEGALGMIRRFGSGIVVNITVQGNVVGNQEFANQVAHTIGKQLGMAY